MELCGVPHAKRDTVEARFKARVKPIPGGRGFERHHGLAPKGASPRCRPLPHRNHLGSWKLLEGRLEALQAAASVGALQEDTERCHEWLSEA